MKKKIIAIGLIVYSVLIVSCNSADVQKDVELDGVWQKCGYGQVIEINDSTVNSYDITGISVITRNTISRKEFEQKEILNISSKDTLYIQSGINIYKYYKIAEIPDFKTDSLRFADAEYNFDVFWNTFKENYAFFEIRGVDWDSIYSLYKPKINNCVNEYELYSILKSAVAALNDGHADVRASEFLMEKYDKEFSNNNIQSVGNENDSSYLSVGETRRSILKHYVKTPKFYGKDMEGEGLCSWGKINSDVGYIQINSMMFFADYNLPDSLSSYDYLFAYFNEMYANKNHEIQEVESIRVLMDSIVTQFKEVKAIILDLRFNVGGHDVVAMEILNHFSSKEAIAFSKKAKMKQSFTVEQKISISPSKINSDARLFILTSQMTSSASEILVLSSLELDNTVRLGANTMGIFSDILEKKLPNGWDFYLSNEVYSDTKGVVYEKVGIEPDTRFDYPKEEYLFLSKLENDLKSSGDEAIEYVINETNK